MAHYTYLIIGGGMTAGAAVGGIREVDAHGSVGLIGADPHPPYDRPPLSKGLWKGKALEIIWRKIEPQGVALHLGRQARTLDPPNKRVTDDQETVYTFDKLLLATGGTPRRLSFGGDDIIYYRTLDDYERLRALTDQSERFAVGGGLRNGRVWGRAAVERLGAGGRRPEADRRGRTVPRRGASKAGCRHSVHPESERL